MYVNPEHSLPFFYLTKQTEEAVSCPILLLNTKNQRDKTRDKEQRVLHYFTKLHRFIFQKNHLPSNNSKHCYKFSLCCTLLPLNGKPHLSIFSFHCSNTAESKRRKAKKDKLRENENPDNCMINRNTVEKNSALLYWSWKFFFLKNVKNIRKLIKQYSKIFIHLSGLCIINYLFHEES